MKVVLKNKITGQYFGHLDPKCEKGVDYANIECAYKFNESFIGSAFNEYKTVPYLKEIRKEKLKKLNEKI